VSLLRRAYEALRYRGPGSWYEKPGNISDGAGIAFFILIDGRAGGSNKGLLEI
jgi:hypothetical protein